MPHAASPAARTAAAMMRKIFDVMLNSRFIPGPAQGHALALRHARPGRGRPRVNAAWLAVPAAAVSPRSSPGSGSYALRVKRVLLTGMSGTGKSSVVRELAARGFKAVDTDDGWSEPLPDGRQRWREDAIEALLATEDTNVLFVAGCEENQAGFHAQFDQIVLLSAPMEK